MHTVSMDRIDIIISGNLTEWEFFQFLKVIIMKKLRTVLCIVLAAATLVYPGFMDMMSAAGWMYNVNAGNYPEAFRAWAVWMYIGGGLLCAAAVLVLLGVRKQLWRLNYAAIGCCVPGLTACMVVLQQFCTYADQNFPGIRETMQPVSELYRDRILPTVFPALLAAVLAVWNLLDEEAREYRHVRKAAAQAEAPKILEDS